MKVSVVIPLYNKVRHIQRAVESVLTQTRGDFELIVVDDGSTDGSGDVVRAIADPRICLIRQENAGEGAARNRGIAAGSCPLIALLDADDEWLPGFLAAMQVAANAYPQAGSVFSNIRLSHSGVPWLVPQEGGVLKDYCDFFVGNHGHGMTSSSTTVRRPLLEKIGGFPAGMKHGADLATWTRLAWAAPVAYIPQVLSVYHTQADNRAMNTSGTQVAEGLSYCMNLCRDRLRQKQVPQTERRSTRAYAQMLSGMCARELKDAGDVPGAFRALLSVFPPVPSARDMHLYAMALCRTACPAGLLALGRQLRRTRRDL